MSNEENKLEIIKLFNKMNEELTSEQVNNFIKYMELLIE